MPAARPLRAFIAGMVHETNTFSPIPTSIESFAATAFRPVGNNFAPPAHVDTLGYGHFVRLCQQAGIEARLGLFTHTGPSAALVARDHAALRAELLADLDRAGEVDMVLLFMHGAQVAQGCDDVTGELISAMRQRVGAAVPIAVLLDLHANITPALLRDASFVVGCLEYPHTDYEDRARHAFALVQSSLVGHTQPHTQPRSRPRTLAWQMPLVGLYRTTEGPMQRFVANLRAAQGRQGVLSLSAFHGFLLADTPHTCATLVLHASADASDSDLKHIGATLAAQFIEAALAVPKPAGLAASLDDALGDAWSGTEGPVVLADSGDNPGGGAAGDSTFVLQALLDCKVSDAAIGMLWDPVAADFAHRAGVGATLALRLGGKVSALSGRPLDVVAEVLCVRDDAKQAWFAQGEPRAELSRSAALRVRGIDIVVNSLRQQVFDPRCFTEHGIHLASKRLVVVKSSTHFVNGFKPIARRIVFCDSPGSVSMDLASFDYRRVRRPLYPLDAGFVPRASAVALV